jgi:hypothetical protein
VELLLTMIVSAAVGTQRGIGVQLLGAMRRLPQVDHDVMGATAAARGGCRCSTRAS